VSAFILSTNGLVTLFELHPGNLLIFDDAAYRYCRVVRLAALPVIESYRHHPEHQRYADERFRPYAGDRQSIDFEKSG